MVDSSIHFYVNGISIPLPSTRFPSGASLGDPVTSASNGCIVSLAISGECQILKKKDKISRSLKKCGITLQLDASENADLNIEGLEDYEYERPSPAEAYDKASHPVVKKNKKIFDFILSVLRF